MIVKRQDLRFLIRSSLEESVSSKIKDLSNMGPGAIYKNIILPEINNKESKGGLPFRFMLNYLFGKIKEVDNSFFKESDLNSIREIVGKKLEVAKKIAALKESDPEKYKKYSKRKKVFLQDTGKIAIGIDYASYEKYGLLDLSQLRSVKGMKNKYWPLANSLGAFFAKYDPKDGSITIEDKYDFNKSEDKDFDLEDLVKISYTELPHAVLEKLLRFLRDNAGVNEFKTKIVLKLDAGSSSVV